MHEAANGLLGHRPILVQGCEGVCFVLIDVDRHMAVLGQPDAAGALHAAAWRLVLEVLVLDDLGDGNAA